MNKKKVILMVLSISLGTVVLLATFVTLQKGVLIPQESREVLVDTEHFKLDDHNLVDSLHELKLSAPISKVRWSNDVLTLDLKVEGGAIVPSDIYTDMASVASFSFEETANVQQLMLRVMAEDEWLGSRHMLLSADIRRSEWRPEALNMLKEWKNPELPDELKKWFHMSETNLWRKQFILR
ncbi:hypothetical protein M3231_13645 [Neobacillus mesonae]|nr:hypothetical protein [Neobacillus mesonae]